MGLSSQFDLIGNDIDHRHQLNWGHLNASSDYHVLANATRLTKSGDIAENAGPSEIPAHSIGSNSYT